MTTNSKQDPKEILRRANVEISPQTQQTLNKPLEHPEGIEDADKKFLGTLVEKIGKGEIMLFQPSSLLNSAVYEGLNGKAKARAEQDAFNMLATIREINKLWQSGDHDSYQIEYLAHKIRLTKERLEEVGGDIFII